MSDEIWRVAESFGRVLTQFKNAVLLLERDKFGSRAHGYKALEMIDLAITRHAASCAQIAEGWNAAKQHWSKFITGPQNNLLLMCAMLNSGVFTQSFAQSADYGVALSNLEKAYSRLKGQLPTPRKQRMHAGEWKGITRDELLGPGTDDHNEYTEFCHLDHLADARQKNFDPEL
jgi:hypothetical protein